MIIMKRLAILAFLLFFAGAAFSHKFYTSITEMHYNADTRSVEVIIHVFANDLEQATAKFHQKELKIERHGFDSLAFSYIAEQFRLQNSKDELKKINPVGIEYEKDHATIYLEIALPEGLKHCRLSNKLFTEMFSQQTNIVNIKEGKLKKTLVFNKDIQIMEIIL